MEMEYLYIFIYIDDDMIWASREILEKFIRELHRIANYVNKMGRYAFSERSVIKQDVYLMPDQIRLPYHGLCELLQQVIINILVRTYNFSYADAYKKWYKAQIGFDQIVYDIIDGLIKDSDGGIPVLINRNPLQLGRYYSNIVVLSC